MTSDERSGTETPRWTRAEQASAYGERLLTGSSVRLRAADDDDLEQLAGWYRDPEFTVLQSTTFQVASQSETLERMRKWFSNASVSGGANFAIEALDGATVVGGLNIWGGSLPSRAATLAIQIGGEHVGKGYGTDALRVAIDFSFKQLGLNRLQLEVAGYNSRGIRAYEKVGFVIEGRRREAIFQDGSFHDQLLMSVLHHDWLRRGA